MVTGNADVAGAALVDQHSFQAASWDTLGKGHVSPIEVGVCNKGFVIGTEGLKCTPGKVRSLGWVASHMLLSMQPMTSIARTAAPKYS